MVTSHKRHCEEVAGGDRRSNLVRMHEIRGIASPRHSAWLAMTVVLLAMVLFYNTGCAYTTKSLLPDAIKVISVSPVKNAIDLSSEISDKKRFRVYRPGVEVDLTNAVINRFIFDGHLKVGTPEKADAVVEAKLIDYRRDPVRYSQTDDVQEYRLTLVMDVAVYQMPGRKVLWHDKGLSGETSFFLTGPRALSEDEAAAKAVEDAARRVVEKTIEAW